MIVYFDRDLMTAAMTPAMGAVSNKNTSPAIEGIYLNCEGSEDTCTLSAYDLEKGMRTTVPARIEEAGSCIINAQRLFMIVRTLPKGEFRIRVDDAYNTSIDAGSCHFSMKALPGEDFPVMPDLTGEKAFSMPQYLFRKFVNKVLFAIAQNDQRPVFNGAYFRIEGAKITIVSCDGSRLAICEKDFLIMDKDKDGSDLDLKFIVPGKTLTELLKLVKDSEEEMQIRLSRKHVIFKVGEIFFFSKLIDSDYIDYKKILPKNYPITAFVDEDDLRGALERSSLIVEDRMAGSIRSYVKFSLEDGKLNLFTTSVNGSVLDEVAVRSEGGDIVIGFNCKILLDAVKACDSGELKICLSTPLMGISIEPAEGKEDDGKYLFFVMPLRMNN